MKASTEHRPARARERGRGKRAFTLIDLTVAGSVLVILAGALVPRLSHQASGSRDARRVRDIERVAEAIERYHADHGEYPAPAGNPTYGGWDVCHDGDFIPALTAGGYLPAPACDPVGDDAYHYRYYTYLGGAYGCEGPGPFYVLGIRNLETSEASAATHGTVRCSGRDWGVEFAHVRGGGIVSP